MTLKSSDTAVSPLAFLDKILEDLLKDNNQTSGAGNNTMECNNSSPSTATETTETPKITVKKRSRKTALRRKPASSQNNTDAAAEPATNIWGEWIVKPISDAPSVSWTDFDSGYQHTVQNPYNYGSSLLKIQLFEGCVARHVSAVYLYPETEVYNTLEQLLSQLENMWVERKTGRAKINNIVCSRMPLAAWRYKIQADCSIQDGVVVPVKRKQAAQADCTIQDGGATTAPKRKRTRPSV